MGVWNIASVLFIAYGVKKLRFVPSLVLSDRWAKCYVVQYKCFFSCLFTEPQHGKSSQSTFGGRGRGAMNGREGKYPWNRLGQGMTNSVRGVAQGQPQNAYSVFASGRGNGTGPPSTKPWGGGDDWQDNQRNGGRAAQWRGRGRGELVSDDV